MLHAVSLLFPSQMSTTSLSTLSTCTPVRLTTRPSTRPPLTLFSHGDYTCADLSNASSGPVPESTSLTGFEPNNLMEDNTMEIKPILFHKPNMTSTYDTSESIATHPPDSDLDDDQIRNMLAFTSPLYLQEGVRVASVDRSPAYHSFRENSVSSSSHFRKSAGKPAALFTHEKVESRHMFRQRGHFLRTSTSSGKR